MSNGLLLDTCAFVWLVGDQARLSPAGRQAIQAHGKALYLSPISAWEVAVKARKGQIVLSKPAGTWIARGMSKHGLNELPVDTTIAVFSAELPPIHKDPADRIIVATALMHSLEILTPDRLIAAYPGITARW